MKNAHHPGRHSFVSTVAAVPCSRLASLEPSRLRPIISTALLSLSGSLTLHSVAQHSWNNNNNDNNVKVELNVDMLDPLTFRFVERLLRQSLQGNASATSNNSGGTTAASASSTSSSSSKSKSGGGGGGGGSSGGNSGPKKRKNSDGETRPKKQRA